MIRRLDIKHCFISLFLLRNIYVDSSKKIHMVWKLFVLDLTLSPDRTLQIIVLIVLYLSYVCGI